MTVSITKVLYNTAAAIKELVKLDKQVRKSAKEAKKGFKLSSDNVEKFGGAIGKVNPKIGGMITKFAGLAASATPAGVAITAVAAAATFAAANFFDLAGAMRDADATLGDFLANAKKTQELREILSTSGDVKQQESFLKAKDQIARKRLELTQAQIAIDAARATAATKLSIEKTLLSQVAAFRAKVATKTASLETRLASRQQTSLVGNVGAGKTTGGAIIDLAARAKAEAQAGNLDTAEALVARARELSAELGDHAFFTNKIDSANKAIDQSLQGQIKDSKSEESQITALLGLQTKQVEVAQARLKEEVAITKEIGNRLKLLSAQGSVVRRGGIAEARTEKVDAGVRDLASGIEAAGNQIISRATEGSVNQVLQDLSDGIKGIFSINAFKFVGQKTETTNLENQILDAFERITVKGVTTADLDRATKVIIDARKTERRFRTEITQGIRSGGTDRQLKAIDQLITALTEAVKSTEKFGPVQVLEPIAAGQARLQRDSDSFQAEAAQFSADINITNVIKGGVFDAEALKGVLAGIRRAVRQELDKRD